MCNYHIPTNVEMSHGKGLHKRYWKINHFFVTVKYHSDIAGFPNGKLLFHEEWCEYQQDTFTVHVSVFGDIIQFDDPKIIQWYNHIVAVAPNLKLYNALNRSCDWGIAKILY